MSRIEDVAGAGDRGAGGIADQRIVGDEAPATSESVGVAHNDGVVQSRVRVFLGMPMPALPVMVLLTITKLPKVPLAVTPVPLPLRVQVSNRYRCVAGGQGGASYR